MSICDFQRVFTLFVNPFFLMIRNPALIDAFRKNKVIDYYYTFFNIGCQFSRQYFDNNKKAN